MSTQSLPDGRSSPSSALPKDGAPTRDSDKDADPERHRSSSDQSEDDQMAGGRAKDFGRQKRKKAKRACAACQRAHLTCSDERPCGRCIKRGYADSCQDGHRKKAKYMADVPNEDLDPGRMRLYSRPNGPNNETEHGNVPVANVAAAAVQPASYLSSRQPPSQGMPLAYPTAPSQHRIPPQLAEGGQFALNGTAPSPATTQFSPNRQSPIQQLASPLDQPAQNMHPQSTFDTPYFDSADPTLLNFDLSDMNFGNHYGALEFGMLGQMSSGVNDLSMAQSPVRSAGMHSHSFDATNFLDHRIPSDYVFGQQGWTGTNSGPTSTINFDGNSESDVPLFPIADRPMSGYGLTVNNAVPATNLPANTDTILSPDGTTRAAQMNAPKPGTQPPRHRRSSQPEKKPSKRHKQSERTNDPSDSVSKNFITALGPSENQNVARRRRLGSSVYSSVKQPYPYTLAFHALTAMLSRRFSSMKRYRIARALSSIRPSFIALNRSLTNDDLIFMEKCFQRSIWDYDEFCNAIGTPTIICRRTGEVAHVSPAFTYLTGWPKDVLLGKAPNLNANERSPRSGEDTGLPSGVQTATSSRGGFNTPRVPNDFPTKVNDTIDESAAASGVSSSAASIKKMSSTTAPAEGGPSSRTQPIFLAELLDDDSVVKFYEDYAQLAFADSKGCKQNPCKLLAYRPRDCPDSPHAATAAEEGTKNGAPGAGADANADSTLAAPREEKPSVMTAGPSAKAMRRLGDNNGKINCMFCWMVKRDVFSIPMMIVINFLPVM